MLSPDETRMVQLQNGMLVFNWRRVSDATSYPRFTTTKPALDALIQQFEAFVSEHSLGAFEPEQWEVTYVNHVPRGTVWKSPADWHLVIPGLLGPATTAAESVSSPLETMSGEWHFEIAPRRGRLHVNLHHGWVGPSQSSPEVLVVVLAARGPVAEEGQAGLDKGLNEGHLAVVETFARVTGSQAHMSWERAT